MPPKVTVTHDRVETPSQGIVKQANQTYTVTDARGRQIGIRKMNALQKARMLRVIGQGNDENTAYLSYVSIAFHVVKIDDYNVAFPGTELGVEALIQMLDDEGMEAVVQGVKKYFPPAESLNAAEEEIKNSQGTQD